MKLNETKPIPFTLLDCMLLVVGFAVAMWLFKRQFPVGLDHLLEAPDWHMPSLIAFYTFYFVCGPTLLGPVLIALQYLRGRRGRLWPGEAAWLTVSALEWPSWLLNVGNTWNDFTVLLADIQTFWVPPVEVLVAAASVVWHFRAGRPWYWTHTLGLLVAIVNSVAGSVVELTAMLER